MDTAITRIKRKFETIRVDAMLSQIVREFEKEIADLVSDDQLFKKGIDGDGSKITPKYTPLTKAIKRKKGQPTDRVTLRDTGKFHESFFLNVLIRQGFEVQARDVKTAALVEKYGEKILDLTADSKNRLSADFVKSRVQQMVRARFGL